MNKLILALCPVVMLIGLVGNASASTNQGHLQNQSQARDHWVRPNARMWAITNFERGEFDDFILDVLDIEEDYDAWDDPELDYLLDKWMDDPRSAEGDDALSQFLMSTKDRKRAAEYSWWWLGRHDFREIQRENAAQYPHDRLGYIRIGLAKLPKGNPDNYNHILELAEAAFSECPGLFLLNIEFVLDDGGNVTTAYNLLFNKTEKGVTATLDVRNLLTGEVRTETCSNARLEEILNQR